MSSSSLMGRISEIKSILVIHQGALGDFILALPSLANLRRAIPEAQTVIMGYLRILELVEERFYAKRILSVDQKGMASFFIKDGPLDRQLTQFFGSFDLIIVFGKEEGVLIRNLRRVAKGEVLHINSIPKWDEGIHLTDHLLKQFRNFGISISEQNPRLYLNEVDLNWSVNFWKEKGVSEEERAKVIIIHPGSGSKKKLWPLKRFLGLFHRLREIFGSKVLIILGPAEGPEVERYFEGVEPNPPVVAKGLSLLQLASVMKGCGFFIGNDSGISHMASALGIPTISIFGPTDQRVWSPRGENVLVIRRNIPCSPCPEERFFLCKEIKCLDEIEEWEVIEGIKKLGIKI